MNIAVKALKFGAFDYVEKNSGAMARVTSVIKRVFRIQNFMEDKKHEVKYKSLFAASIVSLFVALIYFHYKYPQVFNM